MTNLVGFVVAALAALAFMVKENYYAMLWAGISATLFLALWLTP